MASIPAIHVIGGGLAGCEAAWQVARMGVPVVLHEMRPLMQTPAHQSEGLAELVCSNSLRSDDADSNAVGLLHEEMRRSDGLVMAAADACRVPAGSALAVDRDGFSAEVTRRIAQQPLIRVERSVIETLPAGGNVIIATGPLTHAPLAEAIRALTGSEHLAFFDAIAPIVLKESINFDIAWFESRWGKGDGSDYINCPLDKAQYHHFVEALLASEKADFKQWERDTPYFEGCMPIEVMAERGPQTLRFGPMKPVGLTNPATGRRAWAVVQLRQDNKLGTLYNMVGFQTKMKHGEQLRLFRTIPGLEQAEFSRLGGLHRNSFIRSPILLDAQLRLKASPNLRFAGQITGVEGYVESAAIGLIAGRLAAAQLLGRELAPPHRDTAMGALLAHITGEADAKHFQPMNVNFGLFRPVDPGLQKAERKAALVARARAALDAWCEALR